MIAATLPTRTDGVAVLPAPWRITFDTNPDDCNLSCVMCEEHSDFSQKKQLRMADHRPHRRMDVSVIRRVVSEMAPRGLREIIPSTMGEPLLCREFDEIVAICREYGVSLNLTTNGTWPHRGPTGWAKLVCPVTSDVKVSWNGVSAQTQESIMRGSPLGDRIADVRAFLKVRDEIALAGGNRCRVTLQCTFMESNLGELPALVHLAAELGVDRVKGHQLWVHFAQLAGQDLRRNSESRLRWNRTVQDCNRVSDEHRRPDGSQVELENFLPLPEDGIADILPDWVCPFIGREAWVNHAGRFDPCCAPDSERRALGDYGNAATPRGLLEIWEGSLYRSLLGGYQNQSVCRKCTLRRPREQVR